MPVPAPASPDPFASLQHAVALCLQSRNARSITGINALRHASDTIKRSRSTLLRALNENAPINQLPDDLLVRTLSYAPLDDRPSASQVCHRWRAIIANLDQCWDDTEQWFSDSDRFVRAVAALTQFPNTLVPVSLIVSMNCIGLVGFLRCHISRMRRLSISLMPGPGLVDNPQAFRLLVLALEIPAPNLRELDLWHAKGCRDTSEHAYLSDNLLEGAAPRLRSLSLYGFKLRDSIYPALLDLTTLCLSQPEVNLAHVITFFPKLEQLHIEATSLVAASAEKCSPHRLELLHVSGSVNAAEIVLTQLDLTHPLTVWLQSAGEELLDYILDALPRQDARRVQLLAHGVTMRQACVLSYASGLTWVVGRWPPTSYAAICDAEIMASISELSIHELAWPRRPLELPSALHITLLEIVLYRFSQPCGDGDGVGSLVGIFSDDDDSLCALQCPALETLSLLSPARSALAVDVFDVLRLIDRRLHFAAERLPCLTLRNVLLYDPELGRGMALLTARVQRIEYSESKRRDVPHVHQRHPSLSWVYAMMG